MLYIFDIDGTVADLTHRLHLIGAENGTFVSADQPKDWNAFYKACYNDLPIFEVIAIARALHAAGHTIVYSTGRTTSIYGETIAWLKKYRLPSPERIFMRPDGDHREDAVVKSELFDQINAAYANEKLGGVFEDRQQVVDMYRARGVRVFQVAKGNF
jgi:phosphoglycolate phosphatase-like HAD superfamily hydrolase